MTDQVILQRLRRFLLGVVAFIFLGSIAELFLLEHYEETLQYAPFAASLLGLLAVGAAWFNPRKFTIQILRWTMVLVAIISLVGICLHFNSNLDFVLEINPSFTLAESIVPALKGSHPLLAPGILFLAGALGWAATYKHHAVKNSK